MKRLFLGISLPADVQQALENLKKNFDLLKMPIKLVEPENSHIAIKFLGELTDDQTDQLIKAIEFSLNGFKSFLVNIENALAFPNFSQPRVLALKVISLNLEGLAKKLFNEFEIYNFLPAEERKYTPHLTLGRIKNSLNNPEIDKISQITFKADFMVEQINLFESRLTPDGPVYKILKTFKLQ